MKRSVLFIVIITIAFSTKIAAQIPVALADSFQLILNNHIATTKDKGISAAVILANGSIWTGAAGGNGGSYSITDSTIFYAASTTKSFLAVCALQLLEEGKLSLSDPIHKYLSGAQYPQNYIDSTITLYQLLSHTSGIYNYGNNSNYMNSMILNPSKVYAPGENIQTFLNKPQDFIQGTSWKYSNSNYVLVGLIIEAVTGNSLVSEVQTRVFDKVMMPHTSCADGDTPNSAAGFWANIGLGEINLSNTDHTALLTSSWGAGHIVTLPIELAKYCRELIKGNLYTHSSTIDTMLTIEPKSITASGYGYGIGIERVNYNNTTLFGHTGNIGHITYMFHNPTLNYTIVTMTNRFGLSGSDNIKAFKKIEKQLLNYGTSSTETIANQKLTVKVLTNTSTNESQLLINSPQSTIMEISIYDELDQLVDVIKFAVLEGVNTLQLTKLNMNTSGIYFVRVKNNNDVSVVKFFR